MDDYVYKFLNACFFLAEVSNFPSVLQHDDFIRYRIYVVQIVSYEK